MASMNRRLLLLSGAAASTFAFPNTEEAPRFRAKALDGQNFDNASLKGKVVLVQLWATWCKYCQRDQAAVDDVVDTFSKDGLVVLAVNMGESKKKVLKYLEENPRKGNIVLLPETNLGAAFSGKGYPHYAVLDRSGKVVGQRSGSGGVEALQNMLSLAGLLAKD